MEDLAEGLEQRPVGLQRLKQAQLRAVGLRTAPVAAVDRLHQEQATEGLAENNNKKIIKQNRQMEME